MPALGPLWKKHLFFLRQLPPDVGRIVATGSGAPCRAAQEGEDPAQGRGAGRGLAGFLSERTDPRWSPSTGEKFSLPGNEASLMHSGPDSVLITGVSPRQWELCKRVDGAG